MPAGSHFTKVLMFCEGFQRVALAFTSLTLLLSESRRTDRCNPLITKERETGIEPATSSLGKMDDD